MEDIKYLECIHCKKFWDCNKKKDKAGRCLDFEMEKKNENV